VIRKALSLYEAEKEAKEKAQEATSQREAAQLTSGKKLEQEDGEIYSARVSDVEIENVNDDDDDDSEELEGK
jgi:hypothetical protein